MNKGKVAGEEIVQLYTNDKESSVVRFVRELKEFNCVWIHFRP
ncbi:fibronectin type III-like domain-contianing protein [Cellulophaga sp. L1A9]